MPSEPLDPPGRAWMAGCILHRVVPATAPGRSVKVDGKTISAVLDSGISVTLAQPSVVKPWPDQKTALPITCVHGDTRYVPARTVHISTEHGSWPIEVGIVADLPDPLLLGRDWPGFDRLLSAVVQPAEKTRGPRRRTARGPPARRTALLATDSEREGESTNKNSANVYADVFQQVTTGGSFSHEQREDEHLRHCWKQVHRVDGEDRLLPPHPLPHFVINNGLLYCVAHRRGEKKLLLVVPRAKAEMVIELAHSHPMAGHLGVLNTVQRIRDRFHWPGLDGEVKKFCQACPTCQRTSPRRPPPSPLIPLPVIEVPFERIGMDLVGPLPKSA